ncbi:MAG TPA: coenzyme F420-0:L-glutamate ligase [Methanothrix sp.]|nr:coenzyme F420-0:L-glutamate ligase [Methanothrix sp.]HPJ84296.1 coenzyme F420-0:L-glutamate ligase [Methanothrix sp.]HPR67378.1 coenzyme F420-0:L-glutamate ligase [Methanothrix sp.]
MEVLGIKTDLVKPGDDLVEALLKGMERAGLHLEDGDILVIAESAVATAEGGVVKLSEVIPSLRALELAEKYRKDPREMELIIRSSDQIMGGIPGVVLTIKDGFLYPNAGIDHSNAPPGSVVLFPEDPQRSASWIRKRMENASGKRIGVVIGDSRTHPLRLGCVGVALACDGILPVEDARGQKDLYGRPLEVTRKAVADNLVSAGEVVMGEGDEGVPAVIIRGAPVKFIENGEEMTIPSIPPEECMYIGSLRCGPHPYEGGYDQLIEEATKALERSYAPYSGFRVGAALLAKSGEVYSAANVENASSGAAICAERAAIAKAVSEGEKEFEALAVVAETEEPVAPCGICRQNLIEFGEEIKVIMANTKGDAEIATIEELLPRGFKGQYLKSSKS